MIRLSVLLKAGHTVEIIRRFASQFEKKYGVGLDLEVVSEDEAYERLSWGGSLPDVCTVPYWYLGEMVSSGLLCELRGSDFPRDFHPKALSALSVDGVLWAIPHTLTGGMLFTQPDLVSGELPANVENFDDFLMQWDSLISYGSGVALRAGPTFSSAESWRGLLHWAGVDAFREDSSVDLSLGRERLGEIVDRLRRQNVALTTMDYSRMGESFSKGNVAMMFDTSAWATIFSLDQQLSSRVRLGQLGRSRTAPFFYAEGLGITSSCQYPEVAIDFIQWRHSSEIIREEVVSLNRLDFPRTDIHKEPWFSPLLSEGTNAVVMEEIESSWNLVPDDYPIDRVGFVRWGRELMAVVADAVSGMSTDDAIRKNVTR